MAMFVSLRPQLRSIQKFRRASSPCAQHPLNPVIMHSSVLLSQVLMATRRGVRRNDASTESHVVDLFTGQTRRHAAPAGNNESLLTPPFLIMGIAGHQNGAGKLGCVYA